MSEDLRLDELRMLLSAVSNGKLSTLLKSLDVSTQTQKAIPKGPEFTRYTSVRRNYTCKLCGHTFSTVHNFSKGEKITTIDESGTTHNVTIKGDVTYETYVSKCEKCHEFIHTLDREQLEILTIKLLQKVTFNDILNIWR